MEFDLNDRIRQVMEDKGLSPSALAEVIGVSRPLVSHILSHRNKAGVDMLQKVLEQFTELNAHWLLTGKGSMYADKEMQKELKIEKPAKLPPAQSDKEEIKEKPPAGKKTVKRIILFFNDGSFEVSDS